MTDARLADYDPAWPERYEAEARLVAEALGEVVIEIEHVGSTSVPRLGAKPTIDVAVGVTTLELDPKALERMAALGYEEGGGDSRPGERRFRKGPEFPRDFILHVVEWGGPLWRDHLTFRDALRRDPAAAQEYAELKRRLLAERGEWYRGEDKREFVQAVLARAAARAWIPSASPQETETIAARLAAGLEPGDVVTVSGELGSGKTTFVRGACRALGVTDAVTSPTFTVGHRYTGRVPVAHLDLYRFTGVSAAEWGDLEPYFEGTIAFVEWPEAAGDALPAPRARVCLRHRDPAHRLIELEFAEKSLLERAFWGADAGI